MCQRCQRENNNDFEGIIGRDDGAPEKIGRCFCIAAEQFKVVERDDVEAIRHRVMTYKVVVADELCSLRRLRLRHDATSNAQEEGPWARCAVGFAVQLSEQEPKPCRIGDLFRSETALCLPRLLTSIQARPRELEQHDQVRCCRADCSGRWPWAMAPTTVV